MTLLRVTVRLALAADATVGPVEYPVFHFPPALAAGATVAVQNVAGAGCAGKSGVPRCIQARTPCRGCFGPIRKGANPMVDMMGALTSIGLAAKEVLDRRALLNRYIGAQGRLRPLPTKPISAR